MITPLAYVPFLDPLTLHQLWYLLLIPLVFAIALVYKTLKMPTLKRLFAESVRLTAYILSLMIIFAVFLYVLVQMA